MFIKVSHYMQDCNNKGNVRIT